MIDLQKKDFYYDLPKHLIAQQPAERRDAARLLLLNRETGGVSHKKFTDIKSLLNPGDCIVINDTKVIPARLIGNTENGGKIEMLLHSRLNGDIWSVLVKPGRKARTGDKLIFGGGRLVATVREITEDGLRTVSLKYDGDFETLLAETGEMPLPHYIGEKQTDTTRYNTVYAAHNGSVAAPTAGLHFTDEILNDLQTAGVKIARVTLHVGIGTFRPVKENDITKHCMHSEFCQADAQAADLINETKKNGGRVIAVGTTSCRTIESRADKNYVKTGAGETNMFIYPGYQFKITDGLLTNFHLPESTLIMLVSAFAGREATLAAYAEAVKNEYRFFSYGDCMAVL